MKQAVATNLEAITILKVMKTMIFDKYFQYLTLKILEQVSSSEKLTNFCNFMSRGGKSLKIYTIENFNYYQSALVAEMV